ncbi:MAG: hypothetical protein AAFR17_18270 [Pseudomonadota bacterium]
MTLLTGTPLFISTGDTYLHTQMVVYYLIAALLGLALGYLIWGWSRQSAITAAWREGKRSAEQALESEADPAEAKRLRTELDVVTKARQRAEADLRQCEADLAACRAGRDQTDPVEERDQPVSIPAAQALTGALPLTRQNDPEDIAPPPPVTQPEPEPEPEPDLPPADPLPAPVAAEAEAMPEDPEDTRNAEIEEGETALLLGAGGTGSLIGGAVADEISPTEDAFTAESDGSGLTAGGGADGLSGGAGADDLAGGAAEDRLPAQDTTPEEMASEITAPEATAPEVIGTQDAGTPDIAVPEREPERLSAARAEGPDDLKLIKGVGPKLEGVLNDMGFYHFDQIAKWTENEVAWVDTRLRFKGRIQRDTWIDQAKILAEGGETEFSKRKKDG